jgi:tRNA pseudouridine55 synthase
MPDAPSAPSRTAKPPPPAGVLVVDKPRGPTSHDVVARVRKALRTREVGHAGTLDPMATGVLVVAIGEATKLVPWLTADDKGYEATMRLGVGTDTLDAEGRETERLPLSDALRAELAAVAASPREARGEASLLGRAVEAERARGAQVPPAYSAIKIDGERAHVLARRGEAPSMPPRPVEVRRLDVVSASADPPELGLSLDVAKGYFVRALARDLAEALGTAGHLVALRRVRSGAFFAAEAASLDLPPEELRTRLIPLAEAALRALPRTVLTDDGVRAARRGQRVRPEDASCALTCASAWVDAAGVLVAVGSFEEGGGPGRVLRGFPLTPA